MKSSGAPALFGACIASAAIQQCSCFTTSPHLTTSSRPSSSRVHTRRVPLQLTPPTTARFSAAREPPSSRRRKKNGSGGSSSGGSRSRSGSGRATTRTASSITTVGSISDDVEAYPSRGARRRRRTRLSSSTTETVSGYGSPATATSWNKNKNDLPSETITTARVVVADAAAAAVAGQSQEQMFAQEIAARRLGPLESYLTESELEQGVRVSSEASAALERQHRLIQMAALPPPELQLVGQNTIDQLNGAPAAPVAEAMTTKEGDDASGSERENEQGLWLSRGMLIGAAALYGTNFGCVKLLEESVPMSLAAALRFSVSVIPFVPTLLGKMKPGVWWAGAQIGALNAFGYWAQSESLMTTSASKAAFICSLSVILVPILDTLFGDKSKSGSSADKDAVGGGGGGGGIFSALNGPWFPALLASAGVACLELIGVQGGPNSGDLWALIQPLAFGVAFWRTERSSRQYPEDTFGIVAAQLVTVAVLAIAWCVGSGEVPLSIHGLSDVVFPPSGSLSVSLSLLWTGIMTTALTIYGETFAMKKVSAAESTVILSSEPIFGTAFAAVLLGETVGWNTGLGALLIVAACTWASVGPAIQSKLLSVIAATGVMGASATGEGDVDLNTLVKALGESFMGWLE